MAARKTTTPPATKVHRIGRAKRTPAFVGPVTLTYRSNNSGGDWWLTDQHWRDLEKGGWTVRWIADEVEPIFKAGRDGRWLGALATTCEKAFPTPEDGIREWETITGQSAGAVGCNCCGNPHNFSWIDANGQQGYAWISTPAVGTLEFD